MRFLASNPELCDVTFLVGETREPVCAVKAVLAARSRLVGNSRKIFSFIFFRVFKKMLFDTAIKPREPPPKESKLRAFMKRGSEPLLGMQITQQVQLAQHLATQKYTDLRSCFRISCFWSFLFTSAWVVCEGSEKN